MGAPVNDIDIVLKASSVRLLKVDTNYLNLIPSSTSFPVTNVETINLSSVTYSGSGVFTCATNKISIGDRVFINGTNTGNLVLPGYSNSGTYYYVIATNGTSQFTLSRSNGGSPITTTGTSISGLNFSIPTTIAITARLNGILKGTVTWSTTPATVLYTLDQLDQNKLIIKLADILPITIEKFTLKASLSYLGVVYTSEIELSKVYNGLSASLDKSSIVLNAAGDGGGINYTDATSSMKIYIGAAEDTDNWTFNWSLPANSGITVPSTNTKTITITAVTNSFSEAEIYCTATKNGWPTITRYLKISKNRYSTSNAIINAYKRSTSTVSDNPGSFIYQFSTAISTPIISTLATVSRTSNTATITTNAAHGLIPGNTVKIICISDSTFNVTSATLLAGTSGVTLVYANTGNSLVQTSAVGGISTSSNFTNSWAKNIALTTGTDPLYIASVTAFNSVSSGDYDIVDAADWSSATLFSQTDISRTIYVYKRTSSNTAPTEPTTGANADAIYNFSNDTLTATFTDNTWTRVIPSVSSGPYLWVSFATATGSPTGTDTLVDGEWSDPGLLSQDGTNIFADLTNQFHSLPATNAGVISSYAAANTTLKLYKDGTELTSGVTYFVSAITNITYSGATGATGRSGIGETNGLLSSNYLAIDSLTADAGSVEIAAKYNNIIYSAIFSVNKNKAGIIGNDSVVYTLSASATAIAKASNSFTTAGVHTPNSITFKALKTIGNATPIGATDAYYTLYDSGTSEPGVATAVPAGGTIIYPSSGTIANTANISSVTVKLYKEAAKTNLLDQETVPVGLKGDPGYTPVKGTDYFDGTTPVKGIDYFDAYTIEFSQINYVIKANNAGTVSAGELGASGKAKTDIVVRKGNTTLTAVADNATPGVGQFKYVLGTVTNGTAGRTDNDTFYLDTATADSGSIPVTIYVEGTATGNTYTRTISYAKAKDGAASTVPGPTGAKSVILYTKTTSNATSWIQDSNYPANSGINDANRITKDEWDAASTFTMIAGQVWTKSPPTLNSGEAQYEMNGTYPDSGAAGTAYVVWTAPYLSYFKVGSLDAITANIGTFTTPIGANASTSRTVISGDTISIYSGSTLRVKIGKLI